MPARTRNGSHTSSTVAASSPTATASVDTHPACGERGL